jgi:hypothetical protein
MPVKSLPYKLSMVSQTPAPFLVILTTYVSAIYAFYWVMHPTTCPYFARHFVFMLSLVTVCLFCLITFTAHQHSLGHVTSKQNITLPNPGCYNFQSNTRGQNRPPTGAKRCIDSSYSNPFSPFY